MRRHRGDVGCGFLFGAPEADAPTLFCKTPTSPIEKLIPNKWVLALTARTWAFQNCMSLIPRTKHVPESGFRSPGNFFILNKLAERLGFEFTRKRSFHNIERTAGTVKKEAGTGEQRCRLTKGSRLT